MEVIKQDKKEIDRIIAALEDGAVLVLPTDTVYGLVCDATNEKSARKILKIKNRDELKTFLVFVEGVDQAKKFAVVNKEQEMFLKKSWPGAVTVVLNAKNTESAKNRLSLLVYKNGTIGMRNSSYEFLNLVLKKFKKPLAQTSANISGQPATTEIKEVIKQFQGQEIKPNIVIDAGNLPKNEPSAIIDLTSNNIKIIRK